MWPTAGVSWGVVRTQEQLPCALGALGQLPSGRKRESGNGMADGLDDDHDSYHYCFQLLLPWINGNSKEDEIYQYHKSHEDYEYINNDNGDFYDWLKLIHTNNVIAQNLHTQKWLLPKIGY